METPKKRGFAAMDEDQRRAIASLGGKACHEQGKGHRWTKEQAREAGRKGGQVMKGRKGSTVPVTNAA